MKKITITATATAQAKPIRIHYLDGTHKDFSAAEIEAAGPDGLSVGLSDEVIGAVITEVHTAPGAIIDVGTVSE